MKKKDFVPDTTSTEPCRISFENPEFSLKHLAITRKDVYHKFIMYNVTEYEKYSILDAMIVACEPDVILPYMCEIDAENKLIFIAKCSGNAIKKLVMLRLSLEISPLRMVLFDIILGFLTPQDIKFSPQFIINNALTNRYNMAKRVLNFDEFDKDKYLRSLYCPLRFTKIFDFVLFHTRGKFRENRETKLAIQKISLRFNKLNQIFFNDKYFAQNLVALDLRDNEFTDLIQLKGFSEFKITEIWLDNNPLCGKYKTSEEYINAVKGAFPHVQLLDGVTVSNNKKIIPVMQPCYLGDGMRTQLIKQFVEHFFFLYDQSDRRVLNGLYDDQATFSMTIGMLTSHIHKKMTQDWGMNRNILKFVDYSKCHEYLLKGSEKIISHLTLQPKTIHNVKNMNVDLLHCDDHYFIISVHGHFGFEEDQILPMYFSRTFVIVAKGGSEYCIANDQYFVASGGAKAKNLKFPKVGKFESSGSLSGKEKRQLVNFLMSLSNMNENYSIQFLEEAGWDIRKAITNFMNAYKANEIASEAYSYVPY